MLNYKKSLVSKIFGYMFFFGALIFATLLFFNDFNIETIPSRYLLVGLGIYFVLFVLVYIADIVLPFKIILREIQALLAGKPYKRIYTKRVDEVGMIAHFFNQVTSGISEVSSDLKDRERMLDELTIASQLQRDILPTKNPSAPGLSIVAKNKPATEVGGDSFNVTTVKNKTYIYVGDVTGHGVAAGLIMTMVHSLISVFADMYENPYDVMVSVNRYIKRYVKKAMFMTMVMLCWDHDSQKMTYVGAGHEHILVYRAASGQCEAILSGGVALGMVPDNSKIISEKGIDLDEGDFVVLFTDGITEARNVDGELFGLERLKDALKEYAQEYSPDGVHYHIARDVSTFMKGHRQEDDITLIVMQRNSKISADEAKKDNETTWKD